jgi:methionyl-tRNA synthetase
MLTPTLLVANKHTLFLNKKAGSSSDIKPPMANELLEHYSAEQIRCHYLGFNVGNNNATFMPKPFNPMAQPNDADPVLNEGSLLTNVFNRVLRTLCYTWQKDYNGIMPYGDPCEEVKNACLYTTLKYEKCVYEQKFHMVSYELDSFIRSINKKLTAYNNAIAGTEEGKQILIDALHMSKVALVLLHPVAPASVENVVDFLKLNKSIFDWNTICDPIYNFVDNPTDHKPSFLEPKVDFFKRPDCQFEK